MNRKRSVGFIFAVLALILAITGTPIELEIAQAPIIAAALNVSAAKRSNDSTGNAQQPNGDGDNDGGDGNGDNGDNFATINPFDGASDWAHRELRLAFDSGLIPDDMIGDWQAPISRLLAAEVIVNLIEVSTGKAISAIAEEKGFDMNVRFADTDSTAATFLKAAGISNGVNGIDYSPESDFTRAQMVTMLGRTAENVYGIDISGFPPGTDYFKDVPNWANKYIGWAAVVRLTEGDGSGRFNSNAPLLNQHMGVFVYRAYRNVFSD